MLPSYDSMFEKDRKKKKESKKSNKQFNGSNNGQLKLAAWYGEDHVNVTLTYRLNYPSIPSGMACGGACYVWGRA